jgi:hypothetical protein
VPWVRDWLYSSIVIKKLTTEQALEVVKRLRKKEARFVKSCFSR